MDAGLLRSKDLRLIQEELTEEQEKSSDDEEINLRRTWSVHSVA
jgi:hypothetical protein